MLVGEGAQGRRSQDGSSSALIVTSVSPVASESRERGAEDLVNMGQAGDE